jgi:hypothetical protein
LYLVRTPDHGPSAVKTGSLGLRPRKLNGPSICSVSGQPHRARTRVHHGSHNLNSLARVSISLPKPRESTATSEDLTGGELTRNSPIFRCFLQHLRISPVIRVGRGPVQIRAPRLSSRVFPGVSGDRERVRRRSHLRRTVDGRSAPAGQRDRSRRDLNRLGDPREPRVAPARLAVREMPRQLARLPYPEPAQGVAFPGVDDLAGVLAPPAADQLLVFVGEPAACPEQGALDDRSRHP